MTKFVEFNGQKIAYSAIEVLMDDDIREELHREMVPCTEEEFLAAYVVAHKEKFGEDFVVN